MGVRGYAVFMAVFNILGILTFVSGYTASSRGESTTVSMILYIVSGICFIFSYRVLFDIIDYKIKHAKD